MIVFLIGFMGSGKTTIGKKLANKLKFEFLDLDAVIEKDENSTIVQIFNEKGEAYFREVEHKKLMSFGLKSNLVLSCGGGTPCFHQNMELMNHFGHTIYIEMSADTLFSRLKHSKKTRPLIHELDDIALKNFIMDKLKEREKVYLKSKIKMNGLSINIDALASAIQLFE